MRIWKGRIRLFRRFRDAVRASAMPAIDRDRMRAAHQWIRSCMSSPTGGGRPPGFARRSARIQLTHGLPAWPPGYSSGESRMRTTSPARNAAATDSISSVRNARRRR
ncbi:hypothetical protein J103_01125 [Burkholderia pseudomallei MSHR5855]|nr:hypothetical protein J103_01125 [Burkholderia pseudomallei MSHR5855]